MDLGCSGFNKRYHLLSLLLLFLLSWHKRKEAKEKVKAVMKKTKNDFIKLKFTKLALSFLVRFVFNHRHTAMNHCILMRSNSVNFLTLYSIIFFDVFFIKAISLTDNNKSLSISSSIKLEIWKRRNEKV